jgi:hypothetical protein
VAIGVVASLAGAFLLLAPLLLIRAGRKNSLAVPHPATSQASA